MVQGTLDDLGTALADVTFVVVDLETTGGSPVDCHITEVGAVKVRGGEVLGEFQTLVNPHVPIPVFISTLTGITDAMVASAPRIDSVLPAFLEFARGSVLVAHNAGFDISFLKNAARLTGHPWPGFPVLDTVHLARQLVRRDEARNHKLSSLAVLFHSATTPDHRALHDARATVDVLHGLIERVGNLGVRTLEELTSYTSRVAPERRRKRFLAEGLPSAPGVYLFKDSAGKVLYVGTSVDIRTRVRSYFTAAETRTRMTDMVRLAAGVTPIVCSTALEAEVRELRLIAEHKPPYNRRSRFPERAVWVKLTAEVFPRLSIVRGVRADGAQYIGPFRTRRSAESAIAAVHEVVPLRQCSQRLSERTRSSACLLAEVGRCGAPCTGAQSVASYAVVVQDAVRVLHGDGRTVVGNLHARMTELSAQERFEDAGAPARPADEPGARHSSNPADRTPRHLPGDRGGSPVRDRRLGARMRPVRTTRRVQPVAPRRRPDALCRCAAGQRGDGARTDRARPRGNRRGDREGPALARDHGHPDREPGR